MGILLWIVLGAISGWIASMIMRSPNGITMDVILGIVGAVVGGFITGLFGYSGVTGFNVYSVVVSVIGAMTVIWLGRVVLHRTV